MTIEQKNAPSEQSIAEYIRSEGGIPGDVYNAVMGMQFNLEEPELWSRIKPRQTYEEYFREKSPNQEIAEMTIRASDQARVAQFNQIIIEMNVVIGTGVTTQEQANALQTLLNEIRRVVHRSE